MLGRSLTVAAVAAALMAPAAADARKKVRYEYDGRIYETRAQCLAAKKRAKKRGAVIGAIGGAAAGALLGGNLGETALASGAGALGGAVIGNETKRC